MPRAALRAVGDMHVAVDEAHPVVRGTVTIGTVASHSVDIPPLLADFHAEHPNVEITLGTDSSDNLDRESPQRAARHGDRLRRALTSARRSRVEVVTDEAIQAAVSPSDPLARRKQIRLADLRDRTLIALPVGAGIRTSSTAPARQRA